MDAVGVLGGIRFDQSLEQSDASTGLSYFEENDVIVAKITPCFENGKCALAENVPGGRALGSTEFHVVRPGPGIYPRFLFYVCASTAFREAGEAQMFGAAGQKRVPTDFVKDFSLSLPEDFTQRATAAFLDRETSKIDGLVAKKQRLIELLDEKRQSLISRAVTQGVDSGAQMKESGVKWLGNVPAHWTTKALRFICRIEEGQIDPLDERYLDWMLIAPNHIRSDTGEIIAFESAHDQAAVSGKYLARKGCVIYSKIRPALNKVCIPNIDCLCSADMYPIYPKTGVLNTFLKYRFLSVDFLSAMVNESLRVAMPKVNRDTLLSCRIPVPPAQEQDSIVAWIENHCNHIDQSVRKSIRAISLLQEYRSALITAAVTGQLDIRAHEKKMEALA